VHRIPAGLPCLFFGVEAALGDAIEMARWSRGKTLAGLRCHSDAGSQFTSIRYGERLAEIAAVPSIGTVGDSFDKGLAS
jgi:putative transposase